MKNLRLTGLGLPLLFLLVLPSANVLAEFNTRIAFGSCSHQDKPQPIWAAVLADEPDAFVFLGDNIYGDSDDIEVLRSKYASLASIPGFAALRESVPVFATWDDHDYGRNDAGIEYPSKDASRQLMLDFWGEPSDSLRRVQQGGIYTSVFFDEPAESARARGTAPRRIQLLLLDLRWNRTPLTVVDSPEARALRENADRGPYEASLSPHSQLLGAAQWEWLEEQFEVDVDLRLIGSSIQVLAEFTGWESWANFPRERLALIDLVNRTADTPALFISGDVHWSELSRIHQSASLPMLTELTSSGLTEEWKQISPNRHRVGQAFAVANYGLISVEWNEEIQVSFEVKDAGGKVLFSDAL